MFLYQSSSTKVQKRAHGTTNSGRTDEVFAQISSASIPPNPKALARVGALLQELEEGRESARNEIKDVIVSDPGLGLYYLSNIRGILSSATLPEDPLSPIYSLSHLELKQLLNVPASIISKHRINEAAAPQLLRLQHTLIASSCAANLSKQLSIEEGKAFSLVNVSQSALNLLAFSYPTQFHKALFNKRRYRASLEESLRSLVGVKADNLVNKLARKVGLPTSLLLDLQLSQRGGPFDFSNLPEEPSVLSIARIGDLLAKANDSEHYPEALAQWEKVEKQLEDRGFDNPKDEILANIKDFMTDIGSPSGLPYQSSLFPLQRKTEKELDSATRPPSESNLSIKKLPERLKPVFEKIYSNLASNPKEVSVQALRICIEELFPTLGVYSGCLYIAKGSNLTLNPSLHFGKVRVDRKILELHANNPISQSIFSNLPQQFDSGMGRIAICGALADCQKQAVLFMEFEPKEYSALADKTFTIFHAIAATLVDVMGQRDRHGQKNKLP